MRAIKEKNFSKSKVSLDLPYLLALQKESWDWFLEKRNKRAFLRDFPYKRLYRPGAGALFYRLQV